MVLADPERIRTRAADLVRTGNEFLAASWMAAATGGRAPIDLGSSAYRDLEDALDAVRDAELPIWRIAPFDTGEPSPTAQLPATPTAAGAPRPPTAANWPPRSTTPGSGRPRADPPCWWWPAPAPRPGPASGWPRPTWAWWSPATA